jgi:hypothetical protein
MAEHGMARRRSTGERSRRGALLLASTAAVGAVLLGLSALAGATVAPDGRLVEPFAAVALGMLALTGAGLAGLVLTFREVRRRSTCGRGGC